MRKLFKLFSCCCRFVASAPLFALGQICGIRLLAISKLPVKFWRSSFRLLIESPLAGRSIGLLFAPRPPAFRLAIHGRLGDELQVGLSVGVSGRLAELLEFRPFVMLFRMFS